MFSLLASGAAAFNQVGLFLGALFCLGLGGLLLGNALYWRVHALRASGKIIGVVDRGGTYTPVYRYTLANGESHEAQSDTSSSAIRGKETGRVVPLLISPHNPTSARPADSYLFDLLGLVLVVPGLVVAYIAFTAYPVTPMTWFMAAVMIVYLIERGRRTLIPKGERPTLEEWRKQHGTSASIDLAQVKPIEEIVPAAASAQAAQAQRRQARRWAPVVAVFAVALVGIAVYQGFRLAHLEAAGMRADGQVVRLKEEWRSGSGGSHYTYYPIVKFRTAENATVEFKDSIGSNPPSHRPGDKVTVLYLADDPRAEAMIDRGRFWNWAIPGLLLAGAMLVGAIFVYLMRGGGAQAA